jgi:cathepsin B
MAPRLAALAVLLAVADRSVALLDPHGFARVTRDAAAAAGWYVAPFDPANGLSVAEFRRRFLGVAESAASERPADVAPTKEAGREDPPPLPPSYDWRANASFASCIGPIVDQSPNGTKCGSCWAVSAVEAFGDRRCIATRQGRAGRAAAPATSSPAAPAERLELSALDLIACDRKCESPLLRKGCNNGCLGGFPKMAWEYFQSDGVVSAQCMPYNLSRQLLCPLNSCAPPLDNAKYRTSSSYHVLGAAPEIRRELVRKGPVQATFTVYEDFLNYAGGIYRYVAGRRLGLHAVKVVGYGVDGNGSAFWRADNSWGRSFGMNGSFLIAEGECGFEEAVYAGDACRPGEGYPCKP